MRFAASPDGNGQDELGKQTLQAVKKGKFFMGEIWLNYELQSIARTCHSLRIPKVACSRCNVFHPIFGLHMRFYMRWRARPRASTKINRVWA